MKRLVLHLAYTGTEFVGWQIQGSGRTVQGVLEQALSRICERQMRVHGAGRTDSGVHALGQVAHCDIPDEKTGIPWQKALNALLPRDVAVIRAAWADSGFHSRISARAKEYTYRLWVEPSFVLPQLRPFVWPVGRLDLEAMRTAATVFSGPNDFAAMQNAGTSVRSTVRFVFWVDFRTGSRPEEIVISLAADGFLKQMVRNMVSALVNVGRGELSASGLETLMAGRDRRLGPATAPAKGLCLENVFYETLPPEDLGES